MISITSHFFPVAESGTGLPQTADPGATSGPCGSLRGTREESIEPDVENQHVLKASEQLIHIPGAPSAPAVSESGFCRKQDI